MTTFAREIAADSTAIDSASSSSSGTPLPIADPPRALRRMLALDDFEPAARRILPRPIHGFIAGGSETNASVRANRAQWDTMSLVPRVLMNTSARSSATTLFGTSYDAPFGIAPMGGSAIAAYRSDVALARAASAANVPMILSGASLTPLERARDAGAAWFQAYLPADDDAIARLVDRVARAGYPVLVLTVDVPVPANRENNVRSGFHTPLRPGLRLAWDGMVRPRWLCNVFLRTLMRDGMPHFENMGQRLPLVSRTAARESHRRDRMTWRHLELVRRLWKGKLVLKGVLHADDAGMARDLGADGIIVSNHGGRQLDGAIAPSRVLPDVVENAGSMAVMLDGGVRRGTDVIKAIALGASFVFVGRPFLYAAAVAGEAGVAHAIDLLKTEIHRDMALVGAERLTALKRTLVRA